MALTGRRRSLELIMALHVRTTLSDASWRSEAGLPHLLPRPGGDTPDDYVDDLDSESASASAAGPGPAEGCRSRHEAVAAPTGPVQAQCGRPVCHQ
jgi:hypothetical protein